MIQLFQYKPRFGMNSSPFCLKIELVLKILNIPFEIIDDYSKASPPKGKLPYIKDGDKIISDSYFILKYINETYQKDLDQKLLADQKAFSYAFIKMIEEHLYWIIVYSKWIDENNAYLTKEAYLEDEPAEMNEALIFYISKSKRDLEGIGIGLHIPEEIYELGIRALESIEFMIKERKGNFIFGDEPALIDIVTFSFIWQIIKPPIFSPLRKFIDTSKIIKQYITFLQNTWNVK